MDQPFKALNDLELQRLDDDELIAYIRTARDSGHAGAARLGLQIMVYGHMGNVERRVRMKVPAHAVEEVAGKAFESAFSAAFDGQSVGEFRSWLHTIVNRRIADYTRGNHPSTTSLDDEEHPLRDEPAVDSEAGRLELQSVVDQVMGELNPVHARVIDLYVFSGADLTAAEVAERVSEEHGEAVSENNVHKIGERFRKRIKELLRGGGDTSDEP